MLLNKYLPKYDFTEVHTIKVKASPESAYHAMLEVTEELPDKIKKTNERSMSTDIHQPMLEQMMKNGFTKIDELVGTELVFGLIVPGSIGSVWKKSTVKRVIPADAREFFAFKDPAFLWVVANFMVRVTDIPGMVTIYTESRTMALSYKSRQSFRLYWWVIRPWSGLIRRCILKAMKRRTEQNE